jgi:hypothetical protein
MDKKSREMISREREERRIKLLLHYQTILAKEMKKETRKDTRRKRSLTF